MPDALQNRSRFNQTQPRTPHARLEAQCLPLLVALRRYSAVAFKFPTFMSLLYIY
ncbi:MAG: hypothetical protein KME26_12185 [Oscillatoria princeps RMCB-10]|nr:hypothetical protein [Oscillatoria princeps RMCB-10]